MVVLDPKAGESLRHSGSLGSWAGPPAGAGRPQGDVTLPQKSVPTAAPPQQCLNRAPHPRWDGSYEGPVQEDRER